MRASFGQKEGAGAARGIAERRGAVGNPGVEGPSPSSRVTVLWRRRFAQELEGVGRAVELSGDLFQLRELLLPAEELLPRQSALPAHLVGDSRERCLVVTA